MNTSAFTPLRRLTEVQELTDEQWQRIVPLLPEMLDRVSRRGRPSIDTRRVLNSVMWVLRTQEPWSALPARYVSYQTAHRYYLRWTRSGVMARIVLTLYETESMLERRVTRKAEHRAL